MKKQNFTAVVLKHIKYKDTDRIYTLLTKESGKISAIAKGVSKITSHRGLNLDTLNVVELQIHNHESGQKFITEVKSLNSFKDIKSDFDLSVKAFYVIELINKVLMEGDYTKGIFELLVATLARLNEQTENPSITVNKFEIKLMQLLGYEPPKKLLVAWRDKMRTKDYISADLYVKNFVNEMIGENMKSLELD